MSLFSRVDPFQIVAGGAPVVVAAPHHGTRPNVDADLGTGPIALALAEQLDARAVVVSDLRRTVDVNKSPLSLPSHVRRHAVRYQNELFAAGPVLVVEIHGHVSGQYDVEITPGFELDATAPGEALFLKKLATLKQALPAAFAARLGRAPTLGVYPLDRDVQKTATATFTFQKIRRARRQVGLEWYGLHIELNAALRANQPGQAAGRVEAVAGALAAAVRAAFEPWPDAAASLTPSSQGSTAKMALLGARTLPVALAPAQYINENVVVVHPDELTRLGALEGDVVMVGHGDEVLRTTVVSARAVKPGLAALPARIRRQISLPEKGQVTIGRPAPRGAGPGQAAAAGGVVVLRGSRADRDQCLWLGPADVQRLALPPGARLMIQSQPQSPAISGTRLEIDPALPPRSALASQALIDRLDVTLGEVLTLNVS